MKTRQILIAISALLTTLAVGADDDIEEALTAATRADAKDCIRIQSIRRTEVANDKTVLFYMSRNRIYMNALPHKCPGLEREQRFMYQTSLGRLCDLDTITVLDDIGFGFSRGPSCGLGKFYPISKADADALKDRGNDTED